MPFTGTPIVTQISDRMVRVTGIAIPAASAGQIALHGFTQPAAPIPDLGVATRFGILTTSYVNAIGAAIVGDLGYVNAPAVAATVSGTTHVNDAAYTAARVATTAAIATLQALPATFTFATGAINLATDTTHGAAGVYTPGVYVVTGAASNPTTITLSGAGTYVFRISGALTTSTNAVVQCTNGADPANVWWVVGATSTLGASNALVGTFLPSAAVNLSIGDLTVLTGRALGFATTTTLNSPVIIVPLTLGDAVLLPAAFQPRATAYLAAPVTLQDAIEATAQCVGAPATPTVVSKSGSATSQPGFAIRVDNPSLSTNSPDLEILVRWHD